MSGTDAASVAARATRVRLEADLAELPDLAGLLPDGALDLLERYVELLLDANAHINLTRIVEPGEVARQHLLDALAAMPLIDELNPTIAFDLGSGGGVPALPLAIARPGIEWLLVDSVGRKATVLEEFVAALGLREVRVVAERAETLGRDPRHRERADLVTARACAALPVLAELALPLLRIGGELLAWKGPLLDSDEEVRRGRTAIGEVGGARLAIAPAGPGQLGGHVFVRVAKVRPTPPRFPRRAGEPGRRPLG
jgi:16S rRNA (guanine527-N7)-methyltransferase